MNNNLTKKASPYLSWFVICCSLITIGLLYLMQRTEELKQELASRGDFTEYLDY